MAAVLLLSAVCSPAGAGADAGSSTALPALGEAAAEGFSPTAERALGDRIMRDIWRDPDYFEDPELMAYLDGVWGRLLAAARRRGEVSGEIDARFAWQPFLVRDRTVNAFALPGGYVGVNLGLIALTVNRDEMASVLAHEMSHVTQRHIVRSMGIQQRQSLVGLATMVLGALAASRNPQAAQAIMTTGQAVAVQGQLNFSRDMEREADRVGFGVLTTAGFAPAGMAGMFERLEYAVRLNDDGSFPYLRTHPLTAERIGEARARLGTVLTGSVASLEPLDPLHAMMRGRSRVLMDPRAVSWERLVSEAGLVNAEGSPRTHADGDPAAIANRLASAYAGALAAAHLHDAVRSDRALAWAEQRAGELPAGMRDAVSLPLQRLRVEIALMRDDAKRADAALDAITDASRPTELLRVRRALLGAGDAAALQRAAASLQTRVAANPDDAAAWALLGQLWRRLNQPLRAVRAEAEAVAARGDLSGALDRLHAGQRAARDAAGRVDFVEASVIDARVHALEAARRRQAEDEDAR